MNRDVAILKPLSSSVVSEYFAIALMTKFGIAQSSIHSSGAVQKMITLENLRQFQIPILPDSFQSLIADMVKSAHSKLEESKMLYRQAEEILEEELGIDYDAIEQKKDVESSVRSFRDVSCGDMRIDSEYYLTKYDEIEQKIKAYNGGWFRFGEKVKYLFTGEYSEEYLTQNDDLKFYIRSTNMKNGRVEQDDKHFVNPSKFTKFVKTGDIITARVGTLGIFAEIDESLDNAICSDNVMCFKFNFDYKSDVYTLLMNSKPIYELIDRLARGSVQQRLNQETLKSLVLPIIPIVKQQDISDLIQESFKLKSESKQLLENAKRLVEEEIEKGGE